VNTHRLVRSVKVCFKFKLENCFIGASCRLHAPRIAVLG